MDAYSSSLRLKKFEIAEKARKVASLEPLVVDFLDIAANLARQIAEEEERTKIRDPRSMAYSTFAKSASARRRNLLVSVTELRAKLEAAKRDLEQAMKSLRDLETERTVSGHYAAPTPISPPGPSNANPVVVAELRPQIE